MSWNVHIIQRKTKTYVSLKKNTRVGKKIISDYIYLGPAIDAVKILTELQVKPLIDEREISYSGEMILEKIADSIGLTGVLEKHTGDDRVARVLRNIIILRTIFPESKRKLVEVRLKHSVLKDSTELKYLGEVYRFMDKICNNLDDITYDLVKNAIKNHPIGLKYLIIDATRIKIWKDRETGLVRFGYSSRNELKSLPQVNLVLGVSEQHIPLFAKVYPGNTQDVKMFDDFIHRINTRYKSLTEKIKEKFIIFDQGNVNEDNIKYLRKLQEQGIYFVSMMKTNSAHRFIEKVDISSMPLIYSHEKSENVRTEIYGKIIKGVLYGKQSRVLVCYNPDLMEQKCETLDRRVNAVRQAVNSEKKEDEVRWLISKYNLKRILKYTENKGKSELQTDYNEIKSRKDRYGFFVLFTGHSGLSAEDVLAIYKSRGVVEEGFRALKSDMAIDPVYHSKDMRIETHTVMVVLGYLLMSILRAILAQEGIEHSFGGLSETIRSGNAVEGFYEHERLKNRLHIWRPIKPEPDLEAIFRALRIKVPLFDVKEVVPTNSGVC